MNRSFTNFWNKTISISFCVLALPFFAVFAITGFFIFLMLSGFSNLMAGQLPVRRAASTNLKSSVRPLLTLWD